MSSHIVNYIIKLIFPLVFNIIFFTVIDIGDSNLSRWLGYFFINIAYLSILITPIFNKYNKNFSVLSYNLYTLSTCYFFIELILGIIIIYFNNNTFTLSLISQLTLLGLYIVIFLANYLSNLHTIKSIHLSSDKKSFINNSGIKIQSILFECSQEGKNFLIACLSEAQNSPKYSNDSVFFLEKEISSIIDKLEIAVHKNNISEIEILSSDFVKYINKRTELLKQLRDI